MEKVLAINSGSSSFKYKLFSLPDEKVIAKGMADRVGLDYASFEIKLADGTKHVEKTEIPDQEAAVSLLLKFLKQFNVVEDLNEIVGVGHRVVNGGEFFKDSTIITKENLLMVVNSLKIQLSLLRKTFTKFMNWKIMLHFITQQKVAALKHL